MTEQLTVTKAKPISIERFKPIFGNSEANRKEAKAIGKSLKPSRTLAADFVIS